MTDLYPDFPGFKATDTSQEAAEAIAEALGRLQAITYQAVASAGPEGLTALETVDVTGFDRVAIQPRLSELRRKGRIIDSGMRRVNPTSGKRAIVWVVRDMPTDG